MRQNGPNNPKERKGDLRELTSIVVYKIVDFDTGRNKWSRPQVSCERSHDEKVYKRGFGYSLRMSNFRKSNFG